MEPSAPVRFVLTLLWAALQSWKFLVVLVLGAIGLTAMCTELWKDREERGLKDNEVEKLLKAGDDLFEKGSDVAALAEYDKAMATNAWCRHGQPQFRVALVKAYQGKFDEALALLGGRVAAYGAPSACDRGFCHFAAGDFAKAEEDLNRYINWKDRDDDPYPFIWFFLAQGRQGKDGRERLAQFRRTCKDNAWSTIIMKHCLGEITSEHLLSASTTGKAEKLKGQQGEAFFCLGELSLMKKDTKAARDWLTKAAGLAPCNTWEHIAAKGELARVSR